MEDLATSLFLIDYRQQALAPEVIEENQRTVQEQLASLRFFDLVHDCATLIASRRVVIPLGPDLFSLQGLRNLGPSLRSWRESWQELLGKNPDPSLSVPLGEIEPLGYVVMQHGMRENRPPKAYQRWIQRFPSEYRESVLDESHPRPIAAEEDPFCLAMLKHYRSLMPMAMEARKPVFLLKPADGAIGAHTQAVLNAYEDFRRLAARIAERSGAVLT